MAQNVSKTTKGPVSRKADLKTPVKKSTVAVTKRIAANHNESLVLG